MQRRSFLFRSALGAWLLCLPGACSTGSSSPGASSGTGGRSGAAQSGSGGSSSNTSGTGGASASSSPSGSSQAGHTGSGGKAGGGAGGDIATSSTGSSGDDRGTSSTVLDAGAPEASTRHEGAYPAPEGGAALCAASEWALTENVCCAQYCSDDDESENCDKCGGPGAAKCEVVNAKACVSGEWPEVHSISDDEPWHYSRSTHFGLTNGGACAFGYYGLCTTAFSFTDPILAAKCDAFCTAYPDLCKDPSDTTLRGNFAAPQGNYYTQFWPSLPGDRDNYLSCGECFELVHTKADGTEYPSGETGYTPPVVLQVVDSCPCSANSKWCCGSGRDHCGEVSESNASSTLKFKYGCQLPPSPPDPAPDHDPTSDESIHLDLSDIAMARLQQGDANKGIIDGVIATKYKRVACPVVGNVYVWLRSGASEYYFSLSVVNVSKMGSIVGIDAKLASGDWAPMHRDPNYVSARPQERYGTWVVKDQSGPYALPVSLRLTDPSGTVLEIPGAIKAWAPTDKSMEEMYYIDTGMQF